MLRNGVRNNVKSSMVLSSKMNARILYTCSQKSIFCEDSSKIFIHKNPFLVDNSNTKFDFSNVKQAGLWGLSMPSIRWPWSKKDSTGDVDSSSTVESTTNIGTDNVNNSGNIASEGSESILQEAKEAIETTSEIIANDTSGGIIQGVKNFLHGATDFDSFARASQALNNDISLEPGYLQSIGLATSWISPSSYIQSLIEALHINLHLPWYAAIALTAVLVRTALFPFHRNGADTAAKMGSIRPQIYEIDSAIQQATTVNDKRRLAMDRVRLMRRNGIKQSHLMIPMFLTVPVNLSMFFAVNGLVKAPAAGMENQGILWFTDLTMPDPYLALPTLTAFGFYSLIALGGEMGAGQLDNKGIRIALKIMPFVSIPFTGALGAGTVFYFFINFIITMSQTALFRFKLTRKLLGIAPMPKKWTPPKKLAGFTQSVSSFIEAANREAAATEAAKSKVKASTQGPSPITVTATSSKFSVNKNRKVKRENTFRG